MTNAEKFKKVFGYYATEMWAKPEKEFLEWINAEALVEPNWIPVSWHEITEAERAENGYPKDWVVYMDCEMPSDKQEIFVTTRYGRVEKDVCYEDGEFSLDSGYDWIDDVVAWMPLPKPYERRDEK